MGREIIGTKQLTYYLEELIDFDALELQRKSENNMENIYIPYMMNDAVEYYLILKECKITGNMPEHFPAGTSVEAVSDNSRSAVIFKLPDCTRISLWFRECEKNMELYQYHQIGHFWMQGQEQWRQLVYMIGTIFDKYAFLGEQACNMEEQKLLALITFAPFRCWSPVREDLESRYPDTLAGIRCMHTLAAEAGDDWYRRLTGLYVFLFRLRFVPMRPMTKMMARALNHSGRCRLYQLIYEKVCRASELYQERDYGEVWNKKIRKERFRLEKKLHMQGFIGNYPLFQRENVTILAVEEHPFTVLEAEDISFRIQLMVSEVEYGQNTLNAGFFDGMGRCGKIVEVDRDFLLSKKE